MSNKTQSKKSLATQLIVFLVIVAVVALIPAINSIVVSSKAMSRADEISELNDLSDRLSQAIARQAIERGSGNTMIAAAGTPSAAIVEINRKNRIEGDAFVSEATSLANSLSEKLDDPDFTNAVKGWESAYQELVAARSRIGSKSITNGEWLGFANRNIDAEKALIAVAFAPHTAAEESVFYNAILRDSATDIIHYLGQQRAVYGATLSSNKPITPENDARLQVLRARVAAAVSALSEIQQREGVPTGIASKIAEFRTRFNGSFDEFVDGILAESEARAALLASGAEDLPENTYSKTPAQWFGEAGATIALAREVSELAGAESLAASNGVRSEASTLATLNWISLIITVVALVALYVGFKRMVVNQVEALSNVSQQVANGDLAVRAEVKGENELSTLSSNFNQMVEALTEAEKASELRAEQAALENAQLQAGIQSILMVTADGSDGDLTVRASVTEGALGNLADAFNLMTEDIGAAISDIKKTAEEVSARATEINLSTVQLKDGAVTQTEKITEASGAVQLMADKIVNISQSAENASAAADSARLVAEHGQGAITKVIDGMERIRSQVLEGSKRIKQLGDSTMEISSIVGTIQDISEQTNMLALNAAIEAARAGEHGRGFTVVADEVRKLAERAANATSEIEELINGIQAETNQSVESMEDQISNVERETEVVSEAGKSLAQIAETSINSAKLIRSISDSAKEQAQEAEHVVEAMKLISEISEQAKVAADVNNSSTGNLELTAKALLDTTGRFRT
ncbi:methyl-accepting chemotaxis protein [Cerasicoccus maritimus]|uniref:methyl-accepting chemotaxis protein n=1 Tax=Cerasicoccus maritimus TaxID=490089 RepID=UPI002852CC28|nr:HAMP domain-containing methyl-accepting chemotaxis protein [Cerasicoccus maritimus]